MMAMRSVGDTIAEEPKTDCSYVGLYSDTILRGMG